VSAAPVLARLAIAGEAAAWAALGFAVDGASCRIGSTTLDFEPGDAGIVGWTLAAGAPGGDVDGLPTSWATLEQRPAQPTPPHPNGALQLDHVVIMTPDVGRTTAAVEAVGAPCRRVREAHVAGRPARQAFFRLGEVILEVVGPPEPQGDGPAAFWGMVAVVADLEACARRLGERLGTVRDAVQPGRRIATVRRDAGLSVPFALISPAAPR
jgi:hypothetical protein